MFRTAFSLTLGLLLPFIASTLLSAPRLTIEQGFSGNKRWLLLRGLYGWKIATHVQAPADFHPSQTHWKLDQIYLTQGQESKPVYLVRTTPFHPATETLDCPEQQSNPYSQNNLRLSAMYITRRLATGASVNFNPEALPHPDLVMLTLTDGSSILMVYRNYLNPAPQASVLTDLPASPGFLEEQQTIIYVDDGSLLAGESIPPPFGNSLAEVLTVFIGKQEESPSTLHTHAELMLTFFEAAPFPAAHITLPSDTAMLAAASLQASGYLGGGVDTTLDSRVFQHGYSERCSDHEQQWVQSLAGRVTRCFIDPLPRNQPSDKYSYPDIPKNADFHLARVDRADFSNMDSIHQDIGPDGTVYGYFSYSGLRFVILENRRISTIILAFSCGFASNHCSSFAGPVNILLNLCQAVSCSTQLTAFQPEAFHEAARVAAIIKKQFPRHFLVITGYCYGGSLAVTAGLRSNTRTVTFNAFPVGSCVQQELGSRLCRANRLVTNISIKRDWASNLPRTTLLLNLLDSWGISRPRLLGSRCFIDPASDSYSLQQRHLRLSHSLLIHLQWRVRRENGTQAINQTSSHEGFPPPPPDGGRITLNNGLLSLWKTLIWK